MKQENVTIKYTWRLAELPAVTGLSEPFWRKAVRLRWLPFRKVKGAVLIADEDLRTFLEGQSSESDEGEVEAA